MFLSFWTRASGAPAALRSLRSLRLPSGALPSHQRREPRWLGSGFQPASLLNEKVTHEGRRTLDARRHFVREAGPARERSDQGGGPAPQALDSPARFPSRSKNAAHHPLLDPAVSPGSWPAVSPSASWSDRPALACDRSVAAPDWRGNEARSNRVPRGASRCESGAQGLLVPTLAVRPDIPSEDTPSPRC